MTIFVFLMRLGFAFREAGMCRLKNVQAVLFKNFFDACVQTSMWWFVGYAFAWGEDTGTFIGKS